MIIVPKSFRPTGTSMANFLRAEYDIAADYVLVSERSNSPPYILKKGKKKELRVGKGWLRVFFSPAFRARVKLIRIGVELTGEDVEFFYNMKKVLTREMDRADSDPRAKTL